MFSIRNAKLLATITLAIVPFIATLVKVWVNPDLGGIVASEAPKLFVLEPAGTLPDGGIVVSATQITSLTGVVSETAR